MKDIHPVDLQQLKITNLRDSHSNAPGLSTDWGFACLIEGIGATILFDSGQIAQQMFDDLYKDCVLTCGMGRIITAPDLM